MADKGSMGSTLVFNSTPVINISSINFSADGGDVDVTSLADLVHLAIGGAKKVECTIECLGGAVLAGGALGVLAITWNDGTTDGDEATRFRLSKVATKGGVDQPITTSYTFTPTPAS